MFLRFAIFRSIKRQKLLIFFTSLLCISLHSVIPEFILHGNSTGQLSSLAGAYHSNRSGSNLQACMASDESELKVSAHKDSPFYSLPPFDQLLLPISAKNSICDNSVERLHVLVVLSVPSKFKVREAIRRTFATFPFDESEKASKGNWTRFFLVGKPNGTEEKLRLVSEVETFGDVVVTNVSEGYFHHPSLKLIIALKFASCHCPNAAYFVKTDDDNYVNIQKLYDVIHENQQRANQNSSSGMPMYLGREGWNEPVRPPSTWKWVVTYKEYSFEKYPLFMTGALNVLSMSAVHQMARDCPYMCIGMDPTQLRSKAEKDAVPCLWKFEDTLIGSCVAFSPLHIAPIIDRRFSWHPWLGLQQFWDRVNNSTDGGIYLNELKNEQDLFLIHEVTKFLERQTHKQMNP